MVSEVLLRESHRTSRRQLRLKRASIGSILIFAALVVAVVVFSSQLSTVAVVLIGVGIVLSLSTLVVCWGTLMKE